MITGQKAVQAEARQLCRLTNPKIVTGCPGNYLLMQKLNSLFGYEVRIVFDGLARMARGVVYM